MKLVEDYVKIYPAINKKMCNTILKEITDINWQQHKFYNSATGQLNADYGDKELDISFDTIPSIEKLNKIIWETIRTYILDDMNKPYFQGWSGFTIPRFNRYEKNRLMGIHCDHIQSMFDGQRKGIPTLSVLGLLNDNYEGGKLLMFDNENEIKLKQGDIVIFPSVFLYPQRVTEVTKGVRHSFVSWVW